MAASKPISVSNLSSDVPFSSVPTIISSQSSKIAAAQSTNVSRRLGLGLIALTASSAAAAAVPVEVANALDMRLIAPEQSLEEAESGIRGHAEVLLQVRELIESEAWKEAQKRVRSSSPLLKQDLHTIIQYKPLAERPSLRKLYSLLFNNATQLDYAARDRDGERVWECYENMVKAVTEILSRV